MTLTVLEKLYDAILCYFAFLKVHRLLSCEGIVGMLFQKAKGEGKQDTYQQ